MKRIIDIDEHWEGARRGEGMGCHVMNPTAKAQNAGEKGTPAVEPIETIIAQHPFLRGLEAQYLRTLADNSMRMHYRPGEFIFHEGEPANRFYLIEKGRILLEAPRPDEPPVMIQAIGPGDVLGWSWLFPPFYWNFDARVVEPTTAIFFYGTRLLEACEQDPRFGYELMKRTAQVVIQRLQATRHRLLATGQ